MIDFRCTEDLAKIKPENPAYDTVKELVDQLISAYTDPGQVYDWEAYGFVSLLSCPSEVNDTLDELYDGATIKTIPWEGRPAACR